MSQEFFPAPNLPRVYAYSDTNFPHCLKVGFTNRTVLERMREHYPTKLPQQPFTVELDEIAMRADGSFFTDHDVHRLLKSKQVRHKSGEWFECDLDAVRAALLEIKTGVVNEDNRVLNFGLRPEQQMAVDKARAYFESAHREDANKTPHFLWNAKMRFGKTFATYQLAKNMGWKKILILTFKPAVQNAWAEDLANHLDFKGWQFIARNNDMRFEQADKNKPIVCFGSFQDYLGKNTVGGIKAKNE